MNRDGFTSPAMVRALLEVTTATAGPPRRVRRQHLSRSWLLLLPLLALAALVFLGGAL